MTHAIPPADLLDDVVRALAPAFRLDARVATAPDRTVYHAWDRVLKRFVALHVLLAPDSPGRAWFLRETETLAALDHPAIRHVYAAGLVGTFAYRTANWVEGESLAEALRRGPRAIPTAHALVRDLQARPGDRYYTATEMLEDFVSDAGVFQEPAAAPQVAEAGFERRLRRALGDDYELLEVIGTGGFGRVYRARDLGLERDVAMKVLHPSLTADPLVMERFRREAQLAARLRNPSVVNIYDIRSRAGLQWYTMELVPGTNLAQLVQKQGPLSVDQTVRVLDQALSALEHAHPLGLVHRDLKPENMLIEPDGRLRITDFGLALALRGDARWGGATSRSGTPQFAAPEQLLGERVDQRADLYSLAATAYFALLGRPPYEGPTPEAILARQTTEDLPSLHESRKDVPRELEDVLRKALASEPAARYQTATAFRDALRRSRGLLFRLRALLWGK